MASALDLVIKIAVENSEADSKIDQTKKKVKEFDDTAGNAQGVSKLSALTVATGQLIERAFEKCVEAAKNFAQAAIESSEAAEEAFAKVDSIADYSSAASDASVTSSAEMQDAMRELSNTYGVSMADIGDAVYGMISATGDTGNATEYVAQAIKLATAGFADSSDAASILATAMNSYGDAAGSAADISDSLIATQNLGVTTVGELSQQMGRAIATASSYSVSLGNLETGYIALTKNGVPTAEATTYLSSMIRELGDSGSTVAGILQEQTGQSFGQLMNSGYSLSDVLGILSDSVDGDSEAMSNLWSSAEAANASSAIVTQGLEQFNGWLNEVENSAGSTEDAFATMSDTSSYKIDVMKTNLNNLLGEAAEPVTEKMGEMAEEISGWLESVDVEQIQTNIEKLMSTIQTLMPVIVGVAGAIGVVSAAEAIRNGLTSLKIALVPAEVAAEGAEAAANYAAATSLWALAAAQIAANAPLLIAIGVIAAIIAIIVLLVQHWDQVKEALQPVIDALQPLIDAFKELGEAIKTRVLEVFEKIQEAFQNFATACDGQHPVLEALRDVFQTVWDAIQLIVQTALDVLVLIIETVTAVINGDWQTAWDNIKQIFQVVWDAIQTIASSMLSALWGLIQTALQQIASLFSSIWAGIKAAVQEKISAIQSVISSVMSAISSTISSILSGISSAFSSIWNGIKSTVSSVVNAIQTAIVSPIQSAYGTVTGILDNIKSAFSEKLNAAKDAVTSAIDTIKGAFNFSWSLPNLKLPHISISGSFSINPPSAPSFSISWYKKAMENAMILNGATIFGMSGGNLLGGGEAGPEVVAGESHLMDLISQASNGGTTEWLDRYMSAAVAKGVAQAMNNFDIKWNDRQLGRMVKTYA